MSNQELGYKDLMPSESEVNHDTTKRKHPNQPTITSDELFDFYERNNICEVGFGKEVAARILEHPHLIIAAYDGSGLKLMLESKA